MILYITRTRDTSPPNYSGSSVYLGPERREDMEIRRVDDFPDDEWVQGNASGFPETPGRASDDYFLPYFEAGEVVWLRPPYTR